MALEAAPGPFVSNGSQAGVNPFVAWKLAGNQPRLIDDLA
jgi:hypothetical protein